MFSFCCVMLVLIDRASRDDSNGCHVVFWSNLDLTGEISHVPCRRLDFEAANGFVTPFLTETFRKKCSNEAGYTSNR